ncbi:MAG: hypothetical protein ACREDR_40120, partial [Blastocatellia bacterium]
GVALGAATLGQFKEWARRGLESSDDPRRIQAYYSLESRGSQEALFRIEGGLTLDSVAQTLRLYVEGLTGRALNIAPLTAVPEETKISDGKTIYLPSVVAEFEQEPDNFRLFKVLAAHAAGQIEFRTYAADQTALAAAAADARQAFATEHPDAPEMPADRQPAEQPAKKAKHRAPRRRKALSVPPEITFTEVLSLYPDADLAMRLFTTIENGRIDFLLRHHYRGIRRDLDFIRSRLVDRRPPFEKLPQDMVPFELLFQMAVCGGASSDARAFYPSVVSSFEKIFEDHIHRPDSTVGDSLIATRRVYKMLLERPGESDVEGDVQDSANNDGEPGEGAGSDVNETMENRRPRPQTEARQDPLSYWASGRTQDADIDSELLAQFNQVEAAEHDLEKGDRAFYYDEWDRELGDYRT